jgi:hypothetical protein
MLNNTRRFTTIAYPIFGYKINRNIKKLNLPEYIFNDALIIDSLDYKYLVLTSKKNIDKYPVPNFITEKMSRLGKINYQELYDNRIMQSAIFRMDYFVDGCDLKSKKTEKIYSIPMTNVIGKKMATIKIDNKLWHNYQKPELIILNTVKNSESMDMIVGCFDVYY